MNRHNWNNLSESTKRALREQELPADLQPRKGIPLNNPKVPYRPGFNPNTGQDYSNPCQDLGIGCDGAPLLYLPTNEEMENWGWTEPLQEWFQQHHNNGGQWYWDDGGFHFIANGEVVGGFANGVWTHGGVVMELHRSFRGRRQWLNEAEVGDWGPDSPWPWDWDDPNNPPWLGEDGREMDSYPQRPWTQGRLPGESPYNGYTFIRDAQGRYYLLAPNGWPVRGPFRNLNDLLRFWEHDFEPGFLPEPQSGIIQRPHNQKPHQGHDKKKWDGANISPDAANIAVTEAYEAGRRQGLSEQGGGIVPPPGGTPPQGMQLSTSNPRRPYAKPRDLSAGSGFYSMPSGQWDWENFVEYIQGSGGFPLGDYTMQDLWNAAGQAGAAFDWSQFGFQYYADYDIWGVALGTPPGSAGFINLQYGEGGWNLYTAIP